MTDMEVTAVQLVLLTLFMLLPVMFLVKSIWGLMKHRRGRNKPQISA